jgi:hypothetical protein
MPDGTDSSALAFIRGLSLARGGLPQNGSHYRRLVGGPRLCTGREPKRPAS